MADEENKGIEILDGAVSTTSSAVTHPMDKKDHVVDTGGGAADVSAPPPPPPPPPATAAAAQDQSTSNMAAATDKKENIPTELGMEGGDDERQQPPQAQQKQKRSEAPFDEENVPPSIPIQHVNSSGADLSDDVSSLQHTNMDDHHNERQQQQYPQKYQQQPQPEGALNTTQEMEEDQGEGMVYYEEDIEHQKALQRRNMLIIIMLLLFLGLVIAIGVGVALAVKNAPPPSNPDNNSAEDPDDDEYDDLGGGIDYDDALNTTSVPSMQPSNSGPCIPVELGIIFDEYSEETGWMLVRGNYFPENPLRNDVVWKSKYYPKLEYSNKADTFSRCFPRGLYTFVFLDDESDGLCCNHGEGRYVVSSEGKVIQVGGKFEDNDTGEETFAFMLPYDEPEPVDRDGDGRDDRLGSLLPYDSSNMVEGQDCENFRLVVLTDEYGIETTWELYEGQNKNEGTLIADGGPYGSEYTYVVDYCLPSQGQSYTLFMYDWDRRGLCCESGEGMYKVYSGDFLIRDSDGKFGKGNVTHFTLPVEREEFDPNRPDGAVLRPSGPPLIWTTLVPRPSPGGGNVKTSYPTESPVIPTKRPTPLPVTPFPTMDEGPGGNKNKKEKEVTL